MTIVNGLLDFVYNFLQMLGGIYNFMNTPLNQSFDIKPSLFTLILQNFGLSNPFTWIIYRSPFELLTGSLLATLSFILLFRLITLVVGWVIG